MKYIVCIILFLCSCSVGDRQMKSKGSDEEKAYKCLEKAYELNAEEKYDSAKIMLIEGLKYKDAADSTKGMLNAELSVTYNFCGDMKRALEHGRIALDQCRGNVDSENYAVIVGNTGVFYRRLGMNDSAAICYKKGVEIASEAKDNAGLAYLYNNLSVLYCEMERYEESIGYAKKAFVHAKECGDEVELYSAMANEGIAYSKKGNNKNAVKLLKEAFDKAEKKGHTPLCLKTINHLLSALRGLEDNGNIDYYLKKGEQMAALLPPVSVPVAGILESKMNIQFSRGDYLGALATSERLDSITAMLAMPKYKLLRIQAACKSALGDNATAYRLEREANAIEDSVVGANVEKQLSEYSVRFRTMEKELEIKTLQQEKSRQKENFMIVVAALLIFISILVVVILWNYHRRKTQRQQREIDMARQYISGLETERTRLSRELHDGICNDLMALGMDIRRNVVDKDSILTKVSSLRASLRLISHEMMPPSFSYASLNEIIDDYMSHLIKPDSLSFSCHLDGSEWEIIPHDIAYQLYRIMQEAVSNIIRHSCATDAEVSVSFNERRLSMTISDNGCGIKSKNGSGCGIKSMRDRAASIGAKFMLYTDNNGTRIDVSIEIPI